MFAGQVAGRHNDPALAIDYAQRALADNRAKPHEILAVATLVLSLTSPYRSLCGTRGSKSKVSRTTQKIQRRLMRSHFWHSKRLCRRCRHSQSVAFAWEHIAASVNSCTTPGCYAPGTVTEAARQSSAK